MMHMTKKKNGNIKAQQVASNRVDIDTLNKGHCDWCGGYIEPEGHDCYLPQSKKQYEYRHRGSKKQPKMARAKKL